MRVVRADIEVNADLAVDVHLAREHVPALHTVVAEAREDAAGGRARVSAAARRRLLADLPDVVPRIERREQTVDIDCGGRTAGSAQGEGQKCEKDGRTVHGHEFENHSVDLIRLDDQLCKGRSKLAYARDS